MIELQENNTRTVLINTGFYQFKGENGVIFDTAIKECQLNAFSLNGDIITLDNKSYIVGSGEASIGTDKTDNNISKICALNMVCRQLDNSKESTDNGGDFHLLVTLPPLNYRSQKDTYAEYLKGEYNVKYKGKDKNINIKKVTVLPETLLAHMSLLANQKISKNALIIDIGGVTTTVAKFTNNACGDEDYFSIPNGMHKVNFHIVNALNVDYSKYNIINEDNMTKFLTDGAIIPGTTTNILDKEKNTINKVYDSLLKSISKKLAQTGWILDDSYDIVMTGGGSIFMFDYAKEKYFPNAILSKNPLFDNLIGLQIIKEIRGIK